ncbi:ash1, partial [Symbiodinium microadriaticum]
MAGYKADAHFYFAHLDGGLVLDAAVYGSTARFANHSCEPNCTLQKWITNGEPRVVLVALRTIKSGSELTYNYQYYQDGLDDIARRFKRQKCACGSPVCCGTIGGRVTTQHPLYEREKWTEKVVSLLDQSESASGTCSSGRPAKRFTMDSVEELLLFANEEDRKMAGTDLSYRYCITTEYERLTALAVRVRAWQAEVELLLASPAAVDITDFDDIVRAQPSRLKVSRALTAKIDLVRRGVKGVEQHRKYLPGPLPPVEVDSSSRLLPVPVTGDRLSWPVFCSLVQALSEATPIRCGVEALYVLEAYQQYSKWCEITFRALKLRTDTYKMESDERTLPQLWYSLLRIAELYDEK